MLPDIRRHVAALGDDAPALGAGVGEGGLHQSRGDAAPAQRPGHVGVREGEGAAAFLVLERCGGAVDGDLEAFPGGVVDDGRVHRLRRYSV